MMKLGCVISTPDVANGPLALLTGTFEEKLMKASTFGYDGVELMVRDAEQLDSTLLRKALEQYGLDVPQIVTGELFGTDGLALVHPDPAVCEAARHRMQKIIQLAGSLRPGIMVNIGRVRGRLDWFPADPASARSRMIASFRELAEYAQAYGVRLTLEPCNRYEVDFVHSTRDGLDVVLEVNHPNFGLMLDTFHMNIEDTSLEGSLREARSILWHVHIADSNRLPPGRGHLDFARIIATLRDIGYDGYVSAELRPLPDPDTAAQQTAAYLRPYLR